MDGLIDWLAAGWLNVWMNGWLGDWVEEWRDG